MWSSVTILSMTPERLYVDLEILQPSQLYISAPRLKQILAWLESQDMMKIDPLPVKLLNRRLVLTDGHHRALAMQLLGLSQAVIVMDKDDLDWEAYQVCADWCVAERITSVKHLEKRIVSEEDFKLLGKARCEALNKLLEGKRCGSD